MPNLQRKILLLFALIFAFYGGIISRPAEAAGAHFVFECSRVELSKGYVTVYGDLWNDGNESGTLTEGREGCSYFSVSSCTDEGCLS